VEVKFKLEHKHFNISFKSCQLFKGNTMTNHENLLNLFDTYIAENDKFENKGNKAAGTRARKALAEIAKLTKDRRKEIQDAKTEDK
jgi:hypothetical protein